MSPEARASSAALARLLSEIAEDRAGIHKRFLDAEDAKSRLQRDASDAGSQALAAVALHGWYTGIETIFERIARELDGSVPQGERWHRDLLSQMRTDVPGLRPAVITTDLVAPLATLLGFRHFFRHAYAVTFDSEQLARDLERLLVVAPRVEACLDEFFSFIRIAMLSLETR